MEDLIELATFLDRLGMHKEADIVDGYIRKNSQALMPEVRDGQTVLEQHTDFKPQESADLYSSPNRDEALRLIDEARRIVRSANQKLLADTRATHEGGSTPTDKYYTGAQSNLKEAEQALAQASLSLTGASGEMRARVIPPGRVQHPDEI